MAAKARSSSKSKNFSRSSRTAKQAAKPYSEKAIRTLHKQLRKDRRVESHAQKRVINAKAKASRGAIGALGDSARDLATSIGTAVTANTTAKEAAATDRERIRQQGAATVAQYQALVNSSQGQKGDLREDDTSNPSSTGNGNQSYPWLG